MLVEGCGCDDEEDGVCVAAVPDEEVPPTAAAAAAEYRTGSVVTGGRVCGNPFLTILDIGCDAKFGFGGGLEAELG